MGSGLGRTLGQIMNYVSIVFSAKDRVWNNFLSKCLPVKMDCKLLDMKVLFFRKHVIKYCFLVKKLLSVRLQFMICCLQVEILPVRYVTACCLFFQ